MIVILYDRDAILTSICRGHEWIRFRLAIITESMNRINEQDCQVLDPVVLRFLILFHAFVQFSCFGCVKLCQYIKETKWGWSSVPCWSKHKLASISDWWDFISGN
jgi:hypothetical protein